MSIHGDDFIYPSVVEGDCRLTGVPYQCYRPHANGISAVRTPEVVERCTVLFAEMRKKGILQMKYTHASA